MDPHRNNNPLPCDFTGLECLCFCHLLECSFPLKCPLFHIFRKSLLELTIVRHSPPPPPPPRSVPRSVPLPLTMSAQVHSQSWALRHQRGGQEKTRGCRDPLSVPEKTRVGGASGGGEREVRAKGSPTTTFIKMLPAKQRERSKAAPFPSFSSLLFSFQSRLYYPATRNDLQIKALFNATSPPLPLSTREATLPSPPSNQYQQLREKNMR